KLVNGRRIFGLDECFKFIFGNNRYRQAPLDETAPHARSCGNVADGHPRRERRSERWAHFSWTATLHVASISEVKSSRFTFHSITISATHSSHSGTPANVSQFSAWPHLAHFISKSFHSTSFCYLHENQEARRGPCELVPVTGSVGSPIT